MPFVKGISGNPGGRPANGVATALRAMEGSPEAVATYVRSVLENEAASPADRKWAATFIRDTMDGTPVSTSVSQSLVGNVSLGAQSTPTPHLPEGWEDWSPEEKRTHARALQAKTLALKAKNGNP